MTAETHPFFDMHTHGFVRVATSTPKVRTADVAYNAEAIIEQAKMAHEQHVDLLLYPEMCLSSYALDDLFIQAALLDSVEAHIEDHKAGQRRPYTSAGDRRAAAPQWPDIQLRPSDRAG